MRPALGDISAFDDQNLIGFADGTQAVGDDESGSPFEQLIETLLDVFFTFVVEVGLAAFWLRMRRIMRKA